MVESFQRAFEIEERSVEVAFTFYYYLGGPVRRPNKTPVVTATSYQSREWSASEVSLFVSNDFLEDLTTARFFLSHPARCDKVTDNEGQSFSFSRHDPHVDINRNTRDSIGSIECVCFANGYLALTTRFINSSPLRADQLLELIRQPELAPMAGRYGSESSAPPPLKTDQQSSAHPGALVVHAAKVAQDLEKEIWGILKELGLQRLPFETGVWELLDQSPGDSFPHRPTRPYVGVLFRLREGEDLSDPVAKTLVQRFIIAAGRTTPSFLSNFHDPEAYLLDAGRNVYGPGGSCVFIGRRGWCVLDAGEHEPHTFRLGVVEASHLAIQSVDTAVRARRRYARNIHQEGATKLRELNIAVNAYVEKSKNLLALAQYRDFRARIEAATSFLARARLVSPCEDMSSLLEAHVVSHTARAALRRYASLTGLDDLTRSVREKMASYTAFVKTSSDYLALLSTQATRRALFVGALALVIATISVALTVFL